LAFELISFGSLDQQLSLECLGYMKLRSPPLGQIDQRVEQKWGVRPHDKALTLLALPILGSTSIHYARKQNFTIKP
jgi:hypothetical protein